MNILNRKIPSTLVFLLVIITVYLLLALIEPEYVFTAASGTLAMLVKVLPVLVLVFGIMLAINITIKSGWLKKWLRLGDSARGWLFAAIAGILISGPPYVLYPMLADFKRQGMSNSTLAIFLYNRNVKIPFIPVSIYYFGLEYTVILSALIVIFSLLNGWLVARLTSRAV